jgi:F0F1-type ATP synthase membrane subunit b/b'
MNETITQLGTLLLPAIPTVALFATAWIGYRLIVERNLYKVRQSSGEARRRLVAIETTLGNLQSKVAAIEATVDCESMEKRIRATVEAEKVKIVEVAESEILAAISAVNPEFRAYATNTAVTLTANGVRVDGWTDEALLRSIIDQLGLRGNN